MVLVDVTVPDVWVAVAEYTVVVATLYIFVVVVCAVGVDVVVVVVAGAVEVVVVVLPGTVVVLWIVTCSVAVWVCETVRLFVTV